MLLDEGVAANVPSVPARLVNTGTCGYDAAPWTSQARFSARAIAGVVSKPRHGQMSQCDRRALDHPLGAVTLPAHAWSPRHP